MTRETRSRVRLASIVAFIGIAAAVVGYMSINTTVEATEQEEVEEQEASEEALAEDEKAEEEAPIPVEVTEVASGAIASYISATANLVPEDQVKVLAEAEGRLAKLEVDEGHMVKKGQVLAFLVREDAEIALSKAELKASNTKQAFDRAQGTREQGLISAEAFGKLEMDYEMARQEVAEAEWRLAKTVIRAPFSGRVTERVCTLGQHIRPGDELFSVADFDPLVARIYLPERDVISLAEGREVRISLAAGSEVTFAGRIRQIAPVVDTATGTVKVTVEAVKPPTAVRPGAFVTVDIVREQHDAALLLPREAVIRELRSAHVFVAHGDTAFKRAVELGLEEDDMVEVLSGIAEGDNVVTAGQGGLDDGQKVKILYRST